MPCPVSATFYASACIQYLFASPCASPSSHLHIMSQLWKDTWHLQGVHGSVGKGSKTATSSLQPVLTARLTGHCRSVLLPQHSSDSLCSVMEEEASRIPTNLVAVAAASASMQYRGLFVVLCRSKTVCREVSSLPRNLGRHINQLHIWTGSGYGLSL